MSGGTDSNALHHLFAEVIDNSMAKPRRPCDIHRGLARGRGYLSVIDNGRGMPVDPHPKFPKKSALEVIMTMLHAGGKFDSGTYETSGGLHGVGVSWSMRCPRSSKSRSPAGRRSIGRRSSAASRQAG